MFIRSYCLRWWQLEIVNWKYGYLLRQNLYPHYCWNVQKFHASISNDCHHNHFSSKWGYKFSLCNCPSFSIEKVNDHKHGEWLFVDILHGVIFDSLVCCNCYSAIKSQQGYCDFGSNDSSSPLWTTVCLQLKITINLSRFDSYISIAIFRIN